MMINIYFNGKSIYLDSLTDAAHFLISQKINMGCAALAINNEFVPRSRYADIILQEGDRIECVTPMEGG